MTESLDHDLLEQYAKTGSEAAFATLVQRYGGLVYSVALRHTGNSQSAQDISQAVFIILARKARSLGRNTVLAGWLHNTARLASANFHRGEMRRFRREQEAFTEVITEPPDSDATWHELCPLLDSAMAGLRAADRNVLLLRYFQNKSMTEVGVAMGLEERTAQKRVSRALEKLRKVVGRRGVTLSAGALAGAIGANSVQAAPAGLPGVITGAVAKGVASVSVVAIVTATTKQMAWVAAKMTFAGFFTIALSPLLTGLGSFYFHRAVARRCKSERERAARNRFGWKIVITNVVMASAGIPSMMIHSDKHPWLFAMSLVAMVLVSLVSVGLQIYWGFQHKHELKQILAAQQPIQNG